MIKLLVSIIREKRLTILYYSLAGLALIILYVSIYPSIQSQMATFTKLLQSYPPAVLKAFGIESNDFVTLGGYLSTEHFGIVWPLMLIFLLTSLGANLIAGEIETGTLGLLLTLPLSRARIYLAKYGAAVVALTTFIVLSVLTIAPVAALFHLSISFANVAKLAAVGWLLGLATLGLGFFFSALVSEKGRVNAIVGGLFVLMYILNLLAHLKDSLGALKYASFFHYFNSAAILQHGTVDFWAISLFFVVALIFTTLGLAAFIKRDISI